MKIEKSFYLILLVALAGCAGVSGTDVAASSRPAGEPASGAVLASPRQQQTKPSFPPRIIRWLATAKIDFSRTEAESGLYCLTVKSPEPMTVDQQEFVPVYFRHRVAESFANHNALDPDQIAVAILSEKFESKVYEIVATAYGVNDVSLSYDPQTRMGTLSMRIRNGDFDGTRRIIRRHVETIVRDKNIQLVTGVPPPPGQYRLLGESVRPGNILEVSFKTE